MQLIFNTIQCDVGQVWESHIIVLETFKVYGFGQPRFKVIAPELPSN